MNNRFRAAVIGCGQVARYAHIRWYAAHPEAELVGLVDPNRENAGFCAAQWGGKPYTDAAEMLQAERPDVVSICSPVARHCEQVVQAAEAGGRGGRAQGDRGHPGVVSGACRGARGTFAPVAITRRPDDHGKTQANEIRTKKRLTASVPLGNKVLKREQSLQ